MDVSKSLLDRSAAILFLDLAGSILPGCGSDPVPPGDQDPPGGGGDRRR